ncbi:hypothetical protein BS50DRAFT_545884 [Corynespora cassiicola Philippines]|uniref:THO complex subunit 2 n=1 Tax=Corynespora cassiicola Philippines TaxID=1448308 RepID=A0A2T2NZP6_CORCC|nr:hypothetical protein BS50DRAFT_545884 [Corynespora cassiicola Philippines]
MAPSQKRKRGDFRQHSYSHDDDSGGRPSPHRPQNLPMAHQHHNQNSPRGGRRGSRNVGRGGASSVPPSPGVANASPTTMSPPAQASSAQASSAQAARPPAAQPAPSSSAPPADTRHETREVPEFNEYITPARVANWTAEARAAIIDAANTAFRDDDFATLTLIFEEMVAACLERWLDPTMLGVVVRDILANVQDDAAGPASLFLDAVTTQSEHRSVYDQMRLMLLATEIPASQLRSDLDANILTALELVRQSFPRVAIRKATHSLYSQSNFNLLREESEGYAKLKTTYFTTVYNEPPNQSVVADTLEQVRGLTGVFHLDVGRVLDITLDVFANLLVRHGKFFVKLLRSSEWWPQTRHVDGIEWLEPKVSALPGWALPESHLWHYSNEERDLQLLLREQRDIKFWERIGELGERASFDVFYELGARRITHNHNKDDEPLPTEGNLTQQQWAKEWMVQTNTLPPSGNRDAAQLLGFKLQFYASDTRDANDVLPENLMYLAALLIKTGFVSIMDLYPHLYPPDERMSEHKENLIKQNREKDAKARGISSNALAMSVLPDDNLPAPAPAITRLRDSEAKSKPESERSTPAKSDEEAPTPLPEPVDQKASLLRSLLCIGAIPEAFFILGRFPWMLDVYPDLHSYIHRLAHHSLSKVYEWARPTALNPDGPVVKGVQRKEPRTADYVPRKVMRWAKPEEKDGGDGIEYRFYWEDWNDNVPICQNVDDVFKLCQTLLGILGAECGKDAVLLTKLARIGRKSLSEDPSEENRDRWFEFSASFMAPALSFTGQNPGVVNEVWDLFQRFDTLTRYRIYDSWFNNPKGPLRLMFQQAQKDTKHICRRISTENTRDSARAIAKLANSCPGIVFQQALQQGQSYSNMIDTLVECSRYLTFLGYDCLTWTFITAFGQSGRVALQGDGMLTKSWLKNTATFIGKVYRRYSMMNPAPILQFIAHHLLHKDGELHFLSVLEQLVTSMAGIGLAGPLTEQLVLAVSSGSYLRSFTLEHHLGDHRHQAERSAKRLLKCSKDAGQIAKILIALGQLAEDLPDRKELQGAPTKVLSANQDNVRAFFAQYLDFVLSNVPVEEQEKLIPGVVELLSEGLVEPQIAWAITRNSIAAKVNAARLAKSTSEVQSDSQGDDNVKMVDADQDATPNGVISDTEMKDAPEASPKSNGSTELAASQDPNPVIEQLSEELRSKVPEVYGIHGISPVFYVTFWQLSLADIYIPTCSSPSEDLCKMQYKDAQAHFRNKINRSTDRRNHDSLEKRQARTQIDKLEAEYDELTKSSQLTAAELRHEMHRWFKDPPMMGKPAAEFHTSLLEKCFIPRLCMSMQDAQFAATMLKFMHKSGVPGFRTLMLLDRLFSANKLMNLIRSLTEENAKYLGRFLNDILKELQTWHENKDDKYTKSAHGPDNSLPGFCRSFNADRTPDKDKMLSYDEFRHILFKWHKELTSALKTCFEKGEYMEIRNSINILNAISTTFPRVDWMGRDLRQLVQNLANNDSRDDLKVAANSLLSAFKRGEKRWMAESMFSQGEPAKESPKAEPEPSKTPRPQDIAAAKLSATAPSFQPKPSSTNGTPRATRETSEADVGRTRSSNAETTSTPRVPTEARHSTPAQAKESFKHTSTPMSGRPESRNGPPSLSSANRQTHALPTRPDGQPLHPRQPERVVERQAEYHTHGRGEARGPPREYGRSDMMREREASPSRYPRRTPDRNMPSADLREWNTRDPREYDDRSLRAPPRDARGPPVRGSWNDNFRDPREPRDPREMRDPRDHREMREPREMRERADSRAHQRPPPMDGRNRMHPGQNPGVDDVPHRRDGPGVHQGSERTEILPPRPPHAGPPSGTDKTLINPDRAAFINDDRGRTESLRPDRDMRRDRGSRPQSPRRGADDRASSYHGHSDPMRDQREARGPPPPYVSNRERREEPAGMTPTGPRVGRTDPSSSGRVSRDMFQPTQSSRGPSHQAQDPNYGRLNQPSETIPSGPRSKTSGRRSKYHIANPDEDPAADHPAGVHPSRLTNFRGAPTVQTDVPGAPSGPRSSGRTPQGPLPSPSSRGPPPTGPSTDRNPRNQDNRNPLRAINSVLTQNAPSGPAPNERSSERSSERSTPAQNAPQIRGRGANRANGPPDAQMMGTPLGSQSHPGTPNARADGQHQRSGRNDNSIRVENHSQEDGRLDSRPHRHGQRGERSNRARSRSPNHTERRPEERSSRNGPTERSNRVEEPERGNERERGPGREKRSDREGGRREREREGGERSTRERRERPREEGRRSGRDDGRDGRKRGREPEEPQRFEDPKRRRSG